MAFVRKLSRGVDAHLVADARHRGRVIEQIGRPLAENHVATGCTLAPT